MNSQWKWGEKLLMRTANCYFFLLPNRLITAVQLKEISFKWSINSMSKKKQRVNGISLICQFTILSNFNLPRVPQTIGTSSATKWLSISTNRGIIFHQDRIQIFSKLVFITFLARRISFRLQERLTAAGCCTDSLGSRRFYCFIMARETVFRNSDLHRRAGFNKLQIKLLAA